MISFKMLASFTSFLQLLISTLNPHHFPFLWWPSPVNQTGMKVWSMKVVIMQNSNFLSFAKESPLSFFSYRQPQSFTAWWTTCYIGWHEQCKSKMCSNYTCSQNVGPNLSKILSNETMNKICATWSKSNKNSKQHSLTLNKFFNFGSFFLSPHNHIKHKLD